MSKKFLKELLSIPSLSGYERDASSAFIEEIKESSRETDIDKFNNAYGIKGNGPLKVLIEGHIDQIGLQVQLITESGFLHVTRVGGIDKKVLPGSKVNVQSKTGEWFPGIIGKKPIHVEESPERESVDKLDSLLVDIGCKDKEEVKNLGIKVGSLVSFDLTDVNTAFGPNGNLIMGPGLDDKIGVYIVTEVFKNIQNENITLIAGATTQEETGLRGSGVLAKRLNPDLSISLDVTFCSDVPGVKGEAVGEVKLGGGPVIMHGSDKSPRVASKLIEIAENLEIPYQEAVSGPCGTNTTNIQESSLNCETYLISIPNRNMHTQVELCSWDDVENIIKLLTEYLKTLCYV